MILLYPLRIPYSRSFRFRYKDGHWVAMSSLSFYQSGLIGCVHWHLIKASYFSPARLASSTSTTYRTKRLILFNLSSFIYILAFHRQNTGESTAMVADRQVEARGKGGFESEARKMWPGWKGGPHSSTAMSILNAWGGVERLCSWQLYWRRSLVNPQGIATLSCLVESASDSPYGKKVNLFFRPCPGPLARSHHGYFWLGNYWISYRNRNGSVEELQRW